ncbi:MAG: hypothetical protein HUJ63_10535 [Enterococcus sp.]|nr:hypothetical protein [Enterococcus sp.]
MKNYELVRDKIVAFYHRLAADAVAKRDKWLKIKEEAVKRGDGRAVVDGHECGMQEVDRVLAQCDALLAPLNRRKNPVKGSVLACRAEELKRLDAAANAASPYEIEIHVDWSRSRTWGSTPRAEAWVRGRTASGVMTVWHGTGTAKGCGYDKLSAAIDEALEGCAEIDRLVVENETCWRCYAVVGRVTMPHLNLSGKGLSTLRGLFQTEGGCAERIQESQDGVERGSYRGIPGWTFERFEGERWDLILIRKEKR